jgi:hypothetical protein
MTVLKVIFAPVRCLRHAPARSDGSQLLVSLYPAEVTHAPDRQFERPQDCSRVLQNGNCKHCVINVDNIVKNEDFWDFTRCGSCKNRRFGET